MCDLFREGGRSWDMMKLEGLFFEAEVARVCRIHLGVFSREDKLAWRFTKDGVHTARSGYFDVHGRHVGADDQRCSVRVWKLNLIPKIQHFMWMVMHGILPTCILVIRFVDVAPFCKRCGTELETTEHALRDCYWTRQFWDEAASFRPQVMDGEANDWVVMVDESGVGGGCCYVCNVFVVHLVLEESTAIFRQDNDS